MSRFLFCFFQATKMSSTHTQLNEIEDAMSNLESTIMHLDAYSRSLESQVKKFEKTNVITRATSPIKD
jgi:exonuclease VII small subunit